MKFTIKRKAARIGIPGRTCESFGWPFATGALASSDDDEQRVRQRSVKLVAAVASGSAYVSNASTRSGWTVDLTAIRSGRKWFHGRCDPVSSKKVVKVLPFACTNPLEAQFDATGNWRSSAPNKIDRCAISHNRHSRHRRKSSVTEKSQ